MIDRNACAQAFAGIFAIAIAVNPALSQPSETKANAEKIALDKAYELSIADSAVKRPGFRKQLVPIPANKRSVTVISLTRKADVPDQPSPFPNDKGTLRHVPLPGGTGVLTRNTWVSLPGEIGPKCRGAADPLLALQMVLGMPPEGGKWELVQFSVAPRHIFRPCASGPSTTTSKCSFTIPTKFPSIAAKAAFDETRNFVFQQMWSSYTKGFKWPGYPFTGMGWTYNWDPAAKNRYGISEYVVRDGAPITNIRTLRPTAFCRKS